MQMKTFSLLSVLAFLGCHVEGPKISEIFSPTTSPISSFIAVADAHVSNIYSNKNNGSYRNLVVNSEYQSYIKFYISGIDNNIKKAKLRLRTYHGTTGAATNNGPKLFSASSDWIESGPGAITWNNKPAIGNILADTGAILLSSWVEYDV